MQHFALNVTSEFLREESGLMDDNAITRDNLTVCGENTGPPALRSSVLTAVTRSVSFPDRPCEHFAFPPPPPGERRRIGPRRKFGYLITTEPIRANLLTNNH